jgi:Ni,Fe-hydrogenase III large subunit/Ni,Fe-hydrogenase III component G
MVSPEIITRIKKVIPDFKALQISQPYADEILLEVTPPDFKELCLSLHKILTCPVMMLFACDERKERKSFVVNCVFLDFRNSQWIIVSMDIPQEAPWFDSLSRIMHSASLFEREIWEMFGIKPLDSHDLRRLKLHDEIWPQGQYPLRKDFKMMQDGVLSEYKFARVEGEGVLEVPVGPVHAGIIGSGHFHFSVAGEPIINLELRLGFTHRGVEKLFEDKIYTEATGLSERVSGDSSFAHSLAFTQAAEKISKASVSAQAAIIRVIFLELERMYNHVNDIGGIAADVGFSFPQAIASVIKEALLQLNERLGASRYLKNINIVGGVTQDIDETKRKVLLDSLKRIKYDFNELVKILNSSVSFMDRVDSTGVLRRQTAQDLGVVGLVARASGIPTDLRKFFPGVYSQVKFKMNTQESGDVLARLSVRIAEFEESARLVEALSGKLVKSAELSVTVQLKEGSGLGYVEGWRGPVIYWLQTDRSGLIKRCKIVEASFLNWQGLSYAVLGNIIPDFPLCNKSFDLSYSGNDL